MKISLAIAATIITLLAFGTLVLRLRSGVWVEIVNGEPFPMRGVSVRVTGASYDVGDIAAGASKTVKVRARGESSVAVSYLDAGDKPQTLDADCYIESGYSGNVRIRVSNGKALRAKHDIKLTPFG